MIDDVRFVPVTPDDDLARPLLAELAVEYSTRYGGTESTVMTWLRGRPATEFAPPAGGMLIGLLDGRPVTGGAFRRFDDRTAELKRIWTDSRYRRKGLGAKLLAALEAEIITCGYRRIYLTTGTRQPEAEALYESAGYLRLDEPMVPETDFHPIAFLKTLDQPGVA